MAQVSGFEAEMTRISTIEDPGGYRSIMKKYNDVVLGYQPSLENYDSYEDWARAYQEDPNIPMPVAGRNPDPLEHVLLQGAGGRYIHHGEDLPGSTGPGYQVQQLLSALVVNPMGHQPDDQGLYSWGELAYIFQRTPSGDIAQQVQGWRATGQDVKADIMELYYGHTKRPDEGLDVIRRLMPKYGHGQTDVAMNADLTGQMLARKATERRRPKYKGGTVTTGLLTSPALGFKRELGG